MAEDSSTKERLLKGARKVFAKHGLTNSSIRNICTQAGVNVAAVSYHFGGKEKLYVAVLQDYIEQMNIHNPRDLDVTAASPPEDRLRAYVRSFLLQALDDGIAENDSLGKLLTQEFIEPSQYFSEIFERFCRPTHNLLLDIVRQILPGAEESTISRCASSIIGQCVLFDFARGPLSCMSPELVLRPSNIEHITDFLMSFSLGGLARIHSDLEARAGGRVVGQDPTLLMCSEGDN